MAVRIGHASIDEQGQFRGGASGDQNGKEVCIRNWYNGSWSVLARAKDSAAAERIAAACEAGCGNENIGYDQNQRNTLNTQAKVVGYDLSKIETACETDCSAFVSVCVRAAGIDVPDSGGNAPTTRTLKTVLSNTGAFEILTDSKYLTGTDNLRRGDILLRPGYHTAIVLDDGSGVQNVTYGVDLPLLKKGSIGSSVRALQILLIGLGFSCGKWGADGEFGSGTKKAVTEFQKQKNLDADGQVGSQTWAALLGIS